MLQILIVEDEPAERALLAQYIDTYAKEAGLETAVTLLQNGKDLLEHYPDHPDLILLDIDMPVLGGLEAARRLRTFDPRVRILFVTRMVQHALEGYEVDATDFIVKPVSYPIFAQRLERVIRKILQDRPRQLTLKTPEGARVIPARQITYVESLRKKTYVHCLDGARLEVSQPLYAMERALEGLPFFRCHNAYLISLQAVSGFTQTDVQVQGVSIPVSKYRRKEFIRALTRYHAQLL